MSAIGSVIILHSYYFLASVIPFASLSYQLLLITPATSPCNASVLKHSRQSANFLMKARGLPQRKQRFRWRTLNFGTFFDLAIFAVVAISHILRFLCNAHQYQHMCSQFCRNGIPNNFNNWRPSSSVRAVVTMEIFIPRFLSTRM